MARHARSPRPAAGRFLVAFAFLAHSCGAAAADEPASCRASMTAIAAKGQTELLWEIRELRERVRRAEAEADALREALREAEQRPFPRRMTTSYLAERKGTVRWTMFFGALAGGLFALGIGPLLPPGSAVASTHDLRAIIGGLFGGLFALRALFVWARYQEYRQPRELAYRRWKMANAKLVALRERLNDAEQRFFDGDGR